MFWNQWKPILQFYLFHIHQKFEPFTLSFPFYQDYISFEDIRHVYQQASCAFQLEILDVFQKAQRITHHCGRTDLHLLDLLLSLYLYYPQEIEEWKQRQEVCSSASFWYKHQVDIQRADQQTLQKVFSYMFVMTPQETDFYLPPKMKSTAVSVFSELQTPMSEEEASDLLVKSFSTQMTEEHTTFDHQQLFFDQQSLFKKQFPLIKNKNQDAFLCCLNISESETEIIEDTNILEIELKDFLNTKRNRGRLSNSEKEQRHKIEQKIHEARVQRLKWMKQCLVENKWSLFFRESMICPRPIYYSMFQSIPFSVMAILCQETKTTHPFSSSSSNHPFFLIQQFCQFSNAELCSKYLSFLSNKVYGLLHEIQTDMDKMMNGQTEKQGSANTPLLSYLLPPPDAEVEQMIQSIMSCQ